MGSGSNKNSFEALKIYNTISENYNEISDLYWKKYSKQTIDNLGLTGNETILDVACGTGSSALYAAKLAQKNGEVTAIDISNKMILIAKNKARKLNLVNIEFLVGNMEKLDFKKQQFDVVICVFGIFFSENISKQISKLWQMVRPGGKLSITVFGRNFCYPVYEYWKESLRRENPNLIIAPPWGRINEDNIQSFVKESGICNHNIVVEDNSISLKSPEEWWNIVTGSGLVKFLNQIEPASVEKVKDSNINWLQKNDISTLSLDVIYVSALKESFQ
jgi:ubiquinone/menaquinone biosynthesis C-methylase UbiE